MVTLLHLQMVHMEAFEDWSYVDELTVMTFLQDLYSLVTAIHLNIIECKKQLPNGQNQQKNTCML